MLERYRILLPFCAVQTRSPKTREPAREQKRERAVLFKRCILCREIFFTLQFQCPIAKRACTASVTFLLLSFNEPLKDVARRALVDRRANICINRPARLLSYQVLPLPDNAYLDNFKQRIRCRALCGKETPRGRWNTHAREYSRVQRIPRDCLHVV